MKDKTIMGRIEALEAEAAELRALVVEQPKTIRIGERDVPEPVRKPLVVEQPYYLVNLHEVRTHRWGGSKLDRVWLEQGRIHLERGAAESHRQALLELSK